VEAACLLTAVKRRLVTRGKGATWGKRTTWPPG